MILPAMPDHPRALPFCSPLLPFSYSSSSSRVAFQMQCQMPSLPLFPPSSWGENLSLSAVQPVTSPRGGLEWIHSGQPRPPSSLLAHIRYFLCQTGSASWYSLFTFELELAGQEGSGCLLSTPPLPGLLPLHLPVCLSLAPAKKLRRSAICCPAP